MGVLLILLLILKAGICLLSAWSMNSFTLKTA
jgi:hypothetical protein